MVSYENAFMAICQNCKNTFDTNFTVINSINFDYAGYQNDKFLNNNINRISCPHCRTSFTYERPFLAYSFQHGVAVIANFNFDDNIYHYGRMYMFDLFKNHNMKFRIVNYMCEASEKFRIFSSGLDDMKIEYLKFMSFDSEYFNDKTNKILLFDKVKDDNIYFNLYSDSDEIMDSFSIPYEKYLNIDITYNLPYHLNGKCLWYKIDTKYIKEYINE